MMKRIQKRALLTKLIQGKISDLSAFKEQTQQQVNVLTIDEYPEDWFGCDETCLAKVKVSYRLADGTPQVEYLTYGEIHAKFTGVVALIPEYDPLPEEE